MIDYWWLMINDWLTDWLFDWLIDSLPLTKLCYTSIQHVIHPVRGRTTQGANECAFHEVIFRHTVYPEKFYHTFFFLLRQMGLLIISHFCLARTETLISLFCSLRTGVTEHSEVEWNENSEEIPSSLSRPALFFFILQSYSLQPIMYTRQMFVLHIVMYCIYRSKMSDSWNKWNKYFSCFVDGQF